MFESYITGHFIDGLCLCGQVLCVVNKVFTSPLSRLSFKRVLLHLISTALHGNYNNCCFILKNITESRSLIATSSTVELLWMSNDVVRSRKPSSGHDDSILSYNRMDIYLSRRFVSAGGLRAGTHVDSRQRVLSAVRLSPLPGIIWCCFSWISFKRSHPGSINKLSKWGSSCLFWKMQTPKSIITRNFLRLRSPSSSFWILVSSSRPTLQMCHPKTC